MQGNHGTRLGVVVLTGLVLWAALWWLLPQARVVQAAGPLFVKPNGAGTLCTQAAPCALPIALGKAVNGDAVYLGSGVYTGTAQTVVNIGKSIAVYGGWNGAAAGPVQTDPAAYPSVVDGQMGRRGVYIQPDVTVTLQGFTITRGYVVGDGGGLYGNGVTLTLRAMTFVSNAVTSTQVAHGGGVFVEYSNLVVEDSTFRHNWAYGTSSGRGAGVYVSRTLETRVSRCLFEENDAWHAPGLLVVGKSPSLSTFVLEDSTFLRNGQGASGSGVSCGYSGSASVVDTRARVERNEFRESYAGNDRGALSVFYGALLFDRNLVLDNPCRKTSGLYLSYVAPFTITNNIIAGNLGGTTSAQAVLVQGGRGQFVNNTIARNCGGFGITAERGAQVAFTNTIVASHTVGISVTAGSTVTIEATLWGYGPWQTGTRWAGDGVVLPGPTQIVGLPDFIDPASGNYRLGAHSAAIDAGVPVDLGVDLDGQPRPVGRGFDIGADEYQMVVVKQEAYLPVVVYHR